MLHEVQQGSTAHQGMLLLELHRKEMVEIEIIPSSPNLSEFRVRFWWGGSLVRMHEAPLVLCP